MTTNNILNDDTKYVFQKPMISNEFKSYINNTKYLIINLQMVMDIKHQNILYKNILIMKRFFVVRRD